MQLGEDFFEPEIIGDVYVSRALKEVWAVNLDLLSVFQQFCETHNLRFFLGFGTLLGAVRHQGFVPWDDDVDILMPRRDFEKLKNLCDEILEPYFLQSERSEKGFWHGGMMKFRRSNTTCLERYDYKNRRSNHGIGLEIMALDPVSALPAEQRQQAALVGKFQRLLWAATHEADLFRIRKSDNGAMEKNAWDNLQREAREYDISDLEEQFLNACRQYDGKDTGKLALYLFYNRGDRYRIFESQWFTESVPMEFAGLVLPAPKGFWQCLRKFYGDGFMGYVAYDKRKPHHPAVWDAKVPYTIWQKRILDLYDAGGKKAILFGTGSMAEKFLQQLSGRLEIFSCVDNNANTWGKTFMGLEIQSPSILEATPECWHVIIANGYYREIGKQLEGMGITDYYVYVDEWRELFKSPGEQKDGIVLKDKIYNVAGVYVKKSVLDKELIMSIKQLRRRCDYLMVFCRNEDMKSCLQELRSVNRVIQTTLSILELEKEYYCDVIVEL